MYSHMNQEVAKFRHWMVWGAVVGLCTGAALMFIAYHAEGEWLRVLLLLWLWPIAWLLDQPALTLDTYIIGLWFLVSWSLFGILGALICWWISRLMKEEGGKLRRWMIWGVMAGVCVGVVYIAVVQKHVGSAWRVWWLFPFNLLYLLHVLGMVKFLSAESPLIMFLFKVSLVVSWPLYGLVGALICWWMRKLIRKVRSGGIAKSRKE